MMRKPCRREAATAQSGLGTLELILAGFLGFTLVGMGGLMFRRQVHDFLDIREQARIQAGLKLAMQSMTLEMANAGALLPDPRASFSPLPSRFTFAYIDLTGRSCPEDSKAQVTYRVVSDQATDRIVADVACDGRKMPAHALATAPRGKLGLSFRYYDRRGVETTRPDQIKAADLQITLKTAGPKAGRQVPRIRAQTVRVHFMNL